jgi:hypothetical protein
MEMVVVEKAEAEAEAEVEEEEVATRHGVSVQLLLVPLLPLLKCPLRNPAVIESRHRPQ